MGTPFFYHPISVTPDSWTLTTRVRVDVVDPIRPVPGCYINVEQQQFLPCILFPSDPLVTLGWETISGQELRLRDGVNLDGSGYIVTPGIYHTIELTNTLTHSELRAWSSGSRPAAPLAVGNPFPVLNRVGFGGPNFKNFDYSVDFVHLEGTQSPDSDGDGIPDDEDACPDSIMGETVVIGECDSGVANILFEGGCTLSDLLQEISDASDNHGQFVSGVSKLSNRLKKEGILNGKEKGAIVSCAAESG